MSIISTEQEEPQKARAAELRGWSVKIISYNFRFELRREAYQTANLAYLIVHCIVCEFSRPVCYCSGHFNRILLRSSKNVKLQYVDALTCVEVACTDFNASHSATTRFCSQLKGHPVRCTLQRIEKQLITVASTDRSLTYHDQED